MSWIMLNFNVNNHKYKIFTTILFVLFILALRYFGVGKYISLERIQENKRYLMQMVSQHYIFAVLIYLLIFTVASFLSIPITIILNLVAGFLFGAVTGAVYVNIGTVLGSTISFLMFRYLLGDFVRERYAEKLKAFNAHIKKHGYRYLLSMQIFPATPTFFINTLAGLTPVSLWTFVWTTSLGIVPGSFVYTFSGQQLSKIESTADILSWQIIVALVLLGLLSLLPVWGRILHFSRDS